MIAYSTLKKRVLGRIWPNSDPDDPGPENLKLPLEAYMQSALAAVFQYNTCLKAQNFAVFPQCATYYRCGLTVVPDRPPGVIRRVWTVAGNQCSPFTYVQTTPAAIRSWSVNLQWAMTAGRMNTDLPAAPGRPVIPFGFEYPSPATDSIFGRALAGRWAVDAGRILVAPWVQSDESVVVEWQGHPTHWGPDDLLPDDPALDDAVAFFVQFSYERDFGCNMERMEMYKQEHEAANADLLWTCREETQTRVTERTPAEGQAAWIGWLTGETRTPPAPATPTAPTVVAFVADYGYSTADPAEPRAVAAQIKSWAPAAIIAGGDNNYPAGEADTIDVNVGGLYRSFMLPYHGTQPLWPGESDPAVNKFWPALGNHDWDGGGATGRPYFDYFAGLLPNSPQVGRPGEPRFYDVVLGPMHFFILNSGYQTDLSQPPHEPLGIGGTSLQATWLQERAALSTAPFKIAVIHHPPYTSVSNYTPGLPMLRWDFKGMGLDLVLSGHGHCYERLAVGGLPMLVCGAGGSPLVGFGTPLPESVVRVPDQHGALRLTADCEVLVVEMVGTDGAVLDTLTVDA